MAGDSLGTSHYVRHGTTSLFAALEVAAGSAVPPAPPIPGPDQATTPKVRSRAGALWTGLIIATVILVLLLVFIIQNPQPVEVSFVEAQGRLSLAVAILLGVAACALPVVIPGTVRIMQLRNRVRRDLR
jgi:uncharacterized integral membrane protein